MEWGLNSPPKPHAFVSLPLQSEFSPELLSDITNLYDGWDDLSSRYLEAYNKATDFAIQHNIKLKSTPYEQIVMPGTINDVLTLTVGSADMSNATGPDASSFMSEHYDKCTELQKQTRSFPIDAASLYRRVLAEAQASPMTKSKVITELEKVEHVSFGYKNLPLWPPK